MILNYCIGCGCDEAHACEQGDTGCWWLRFNAAGRAGVCSRCEDLVEHWDRGGHTLMPQLVLERFHRQLIILYDEASAKAWIQAPHPMLEGRSPAELIEAGELERLHAILDQLRDGAYA